MFVFACVALQLDDWVLCRIYKKSKYALPSTTASTVVIEDEQDQEEQLFKDNTILTTSKSPPANQNTLISQKSLSFSNLLDAMDYSMLSSFLSENHSNPQPGFASGAADLSCGNLDHQSSSANHSNNNSYLFQKNSPLNSNPLVQNMENINRPKRQLSNIDEDTYYPSKKYLNSCNLANSSSQYENPQWGFLMKQSLLNQQLLLGPHLRFQG